MADEQEPLRVLIDFAHNNYWGSGPPSDDHQPWPFDYQPGTGFEEACNIAFQGPGEFTVNQPWDFKAPTDRGASYDVHISISASHISSRKRADGKEAEVLRLGLDHLSTRELGLLAGAYAGLCARRIDTARAESLHVIDFWSSNEAAPVMNDHSALNWARHGGLLALGNGSEVQPGTLTFIRTLAALYEDPAKTMGRIDFTHGTYVDLDLSGENLTEMRDGFVGCRFIGEKANFEGTILGPHSGDFTASKFDVENVVFQDVVFEGPAEFRDIESGSANGRLIFMGAEFKGDTFLGGADLPGFNVWFTNASISGRKFGIYDSSFRSVGFDDALITSSRFSITDLCARELTFNGTAFSGSRLKLIDIESSDVAFERSRFDSCSLYINCQHLELLGVSLGAGTTLDIEQTLSLKEVIIEAATVITPAKGSETAEITSLTGARISAPLAIDNGVSLRSCSFSGAVGLENLRLIGEPFRRVNRRQQIIDDTPSDTGKFDHQAIAARYNKLKKAFEEGGDQAGANELHFREMEHRRRGAHSRADRVVLSSYRCLSSYGLSFGKPLLWLSFLCMAASLLLLNNRWAGEFGLGHGPTSGLVETLVFSLTSTLSLFRGISASQSLALDEQVIQLGLRIIGPILVGLAALGLRSKVKRV